MKRRGFSYIEIVISISIVISLMGLIQYRSNTESIRLENTANEIVSAIRLTKQMRDSGDINAEFSIISNNDYQSYCIKTFVDKKRTTVFEERVDSDIHISKKNISQESYEENNDKSGYIDINRQEIKISFSGSTGTGASILLWSKNSPMSYKITIVPTSARIHMYKYKS